MHTSLTAGSKRVQDVGAKELDKLRLISKVKKFNSDPDQAINKE